MPRFRVLPPPVMDSASCDRGVRQVSFHSALCYMRCCCCCRTKEEGFSQPGNIERKKKNQVAWGRMNGFKKIGDQFCERRQKGGRTSSSPSSPCYATFFFLCDPSFVRSFVVFVILERARLYLIPISSHLLRPCLQGWTEIEGLYGTYWGGEGGSGANT